MLMNKILRYFLLSFLAIVATGTYAKRTVTIDFDNDYQKIFPTLKGVSSGSGDSYVADGDFTDNTYSPEIDGITLAVSAADEGVNTPNRIWTSSPRLRMYSGALVVACTSGEIIEKIEFNASKFDVTAETGTLTDQVWTDGGQTTFIAVFRVTKNTQIKSMTVTLRGLDENPGEDNPDTPSDPDDPFSVPISYSNSLLYISIIFPLAHDASSPPGCSTENISASLYIKYPLSIKFLS